MNLTPRSDICPTCGAQTSAAAAANIWFEGFVNLVQTGKFRIESVSMEGRTQGDKRPFAVTFIVSDIP